MNTEIKRRKLLVVAPFCSLPGEPYFNRFLYLADFLSSSFDVTLLTSSFRHFDKTHRVGRYSGDQTFKIVLLDEPGYKANVGIERLYSHYVFSKNFRAWMQSSVGYDIVYSAYPLIQTNKILGEAKRRLGFKLVIDVQDVWPEAISSVIPVVSKFPKKLIPFCSKANKAYRAADAIVAVSQTYMDRALSAARKGIPHEVVYLGSSVGSALPRVLKDGDSVFRLVYLGTLSYSYDVETAMIAISELVIEGCRIELHVLGGGPFEAKLKAKGYKGVFFHGFIGFEKAMEFISSCDVAINPIVHGASQSVTNKISDYLALGIPIINSQENSEVRGLLNFVDHEHYEPGSVRSFMAAFTRIYNRREALAFKPNALFLREAQYGRVKNLLNRLLVTH